MSFFNKLKKRLFRSSSKIEEGLDAIVEDGGEEEVVDIPQAAAEAPAPEEPPSPEPEPPHVPDPAPGPLVEEAQEVPEQVRDSAAVDADADSASLSPEP
jgi:fused signal recognition particle receptor